MLVFMGSSGIIMKILDQNHIYLDLMKPGCFIGATLVASGIKNTLIIFHGIAGCNIEAIHFRSDQIPGGFYTPVIPTGLNENDCVEGATDKLFKTLRDIIGKALSKQRPPEVVFIFTSDATSIIGDDIHTAAKVVQDETGVKIIALDTPGFVGGCSKGTDIALAEILKEYATSQDKINSSINLIAPHLMGSKNWTNDFDEIVRMLKESGIPVNLGLSRSLNISDLRNFARAEYSYNLSFEHLKEFESLNQKFNIKNIDISLPLPIGIANTEEWLISLAQKTGNTQQAKDFLGQEKKLVNKQLRYNYNFSWMSTLMYGKYCSILGNPVISASLARCLFWDFGIIPKVIGMIGETDSSINQAIELLKPLEYQVDFIILKNPSYFDYVNTAKKEKVDFAIGAIQDKPLCIGSKIPHLSLLGYNFFNQYNFIPWPNFGVRGILGILSELSRVMEDAFYLKDMISAYNFNTDNKVGA